VANTRTLKRSFAGGEISPEMYGRIDDTKYQSGAALLENFIATPQGPAVNRPGFAYVNSTKNNGVARLIPFTFNVTQTMVIEMGAGYFRFHTNGETLEYSASGDAWVPPSGAISISYTTPAVVSWTGHALTTGDPIIFYLYGDHGLSELPSGFKVGYAYTADVIDANSFRIKDNGVLVGLVDPGTGGGGTTNYPGTGTSTTSGSAYSGGDFENFSSALTGLASVAVPGGIATLNVSLTSIIHLADRESYGSGYGNVSNAIAMYEYSTDGVYWTEFHQTSDRETTSFSVAIAVSDISQLRLRTHVAGEAGEFGSAFASAEISTWSVDVPAVAITGALDFVRAYRDYSPSDTVLYGGATYVAMQLATGGTITPGTDSAVWSLLPASLTYEIPNSYAAEDLFEIHYVQSADIITLVHRNYQPAELRRLGATSWTFIPVATGPSLSSPSRVTVTASPGYLAKIASSDGATPSKLTTVASHTLAQGDGVYATDLVISGVTTSGFYMVSKVPVDGTGALIADELYLMDYSGNEVTVASLGSAPTLQLGGKIFDITNYYVVTALTADGINESPVSSEVSVLCNLNVEGSYNTIAWSAVTNAARYYVYKKKNGLFGFIGSTTGVSFNDNNIAPDFSITPPTFDTIFSGAGEYPGAVSYFDQRRCFAGSTNKPQDVWMSKTGTESDFSYSIPVKDTDRIYFRVATREANAIQHIVPLTQLLLMTSSAELRVSPVNSDAVTPGDISVRPQSYVGCSSVQPSVVNNSLVYAAARGGHVREMGYSWQSNGFVTGDLSLRASHLFDNLTIVDQCFAKSPRPIVWFVSSNGNLIGLTYIPEEQIGAWHHHATDGVFESITAVAEGSEDRLYAVIRRTINGNTVRYIERMASRIIDEDDPSTWFFVDAGSTYSGAPATVITGFDWLEGETVAILADGAEQVQQVVTGGAITLEQEASVVHVGLPYNSDLQSLPLTLDLDGFGQGRTKNINKVSVRVSGSSALKAGPDFDHLRAYKQRTTELYGTPPSLQTGELEIELTPKWQAEGQIYIRQSSPLPITVVGITMVVSIGG
jgi:hypothetical protein